MMIRSIVFGAFLLAGVSCKTTSRELTVPEGGLAEVERQPKLKDGVLSARELAETGAASSIGQEDKGNQGMVTAPISQGPTTIIIQDVHPFSRIDPRGYQPTPYGIYPPGTVIYPQQRVYPTTPVRRVPVRTLPGFR